MRHCIHYIVYRLVFQCVANYSVSNTILSYIQFSTIDFNKNFFSLHRTPHLSFSTLQITLSQIQFSITFCLFITWTFFQKEIKTFVKSKYSDHNETFYSLHRTAYLYFSTLQITLSQIQFCITFCLSIIKAFFQKRMKTFCRI